MAHPHQLLVAGGGIGGLAAALACARQGWQVRVFERAAAFSEVGAGVQLGPNVVRVLQAWGLDVALQAVAAFPARLRVRDAASGRQLATLDLAAMPTRYGAPYATIHRADLLALLHGAVQQRDDIALALDRRVQGFDDDGHQVRMQTHHGDGRAAEPVAGDALLGADGLWSSVRTQLLGDGPPRLTGHLAYRALLPQAALPAALRSAEVTAWLGPRLHLVSYPVRGGEALNVVAFVHGLPPGGKRGATPDALADWDHATNAADLQAAMASCCAPLQDLVRAVPAWRLWVLADRPPLHAATQQASGRVALLGDAAHPMRPYLAQGAGMAIEDAEALGHALRQADTEVPARLARYALERWQRNARVQARALRNGRIFHATGPLRWGRNLSLRLLGERLLDMPWLYGPQQRGR
ncbi:FAD-dependent monooxygenase [Pseudorhodoferax sp. Leaf265]|jgi:salicylate hydroxylase|uniref:FAD-dependent monooxygenase n=1 Tax=Pseudorhodoferax sp. Leaf265 TaxID=1736315 RepID=UPI0006F4C8FE|nr:FAD-dependent monooxygenase [Pseudorhodoferax sp. Leaf265]KQP21362.1 FAD-dependent oxidoreductase [Pseudorhodoferax sp. Leaf265]